MTVSTASNKLPSTTTTVAELAKSGHDRIQQVRPYKLTPAPENDILYRPVLATDPDVMAMAESMKVLGVIEPLVASMDGFVLSGHRRLAAARLAKLFKVPCRFEDVSRKDDPERFLLLLREYSYDLSEVAHPAPPWKLGGAFALIDASTLGAITDGNSLRSRRRRPNYRAARDRSIHRARTVRHSRN